MATAAALPFLAVGAASAVGGAILATVLQPDPPDEPQALPAPPPAPEQVQASEPEVLQEPVDPETEIVDQNTKIRDLKRRSRDARKLSLLSLEDEQTTLRKTSLLGE